MRLHTPLWSRAFLLLECWGVKHILSSISFSMPSTMLTKYVLNYSTHILPTLLMATWIYQLLHRWINTNTVVFSWNYPIFILTLGTRKWLYCFSWDTRHNAPWRTFVVTNYTFLTFQNSFWWTLKIWFSIGEGIECYFSCLYLSYQSSHMSHTDQIRLLHGPRLVVIGLSVG